MKKTYSILGLLIASFSTQAQTWVNMGNAPTGAFQIEADLNGDAYILGSTTASNIFRKRVSETTFTLLPGGGVLNDISVSGGMMYGSGGMNVQQQSNIYFNSGTGWSLFTTPAGTLTDLEYNGITLFGRNEINVIYETTIGGTWKSIAEPADKVAKAEDGTTIVVKGKTSKVLRNGQFVTISTTLELISITAANIANVWAVDILGDVYQYNNVNTSWEKKTGSNFKSISMEGADEIWALGNDGKVYRATSFGSASNGAYYTFVNGKPNTTGSYINLPAFNLNSNTVTMEAAVNISAATAYGGIIINRTGKTAAGLMVNAVNSNNVRITYMWNGLGWDWTGGPSLVLNKKYQLALVIEPTKATIYVDGVPYVHQAAQALEEFDGITNLAIDPYQASGRYLSIYIDDIRIWKKSLTQSEIQSGMTCKPSVQDANLVAYYDFNQLPTNRFSIIDLKGNFTLTITEQAQKDAFRSIYDATQPCSVTSISEETASSVQVNAYPNPAKDILHVSGNAEIFDLVGNKVASGTNEINIEHLLSGIYVVKSNGKSQKIVKE